MPGIAGPLGRIAGLGRLEPVSLRSRNGTRVLCVFPVSRVAGALEGVDDSVADARYLVAVEFQIRDRRVCRDIDVDVVNEVRGVRVVLECPANSVPVEVRQTGMEGALNGTRKAA